jgi:hypothetical protein
MEECSPFVATPLSTPIGETFFTDYSVHELPDLSDDLCPETSTSSCDVSSQHLNERQAMVVNTALVARIESLEEEKRALHRKLEAQIFLP